MYENVLYENDNQLPCESRYISVIHMLRSNIRYQIILYTMHIYIHTHT